MIIGKTSGKRFIFNIYKFILTGEYMPIPEYLREISTTVKTSEDTETLKMKCKCGNSRFTVSEYAESDKLKEKPGYKDIIRENDKLYLVKRNFFGRIVDKIECDDTFTTVPRRIVKIKCENCGREYVIFDNYLHGYDALCSLIENKRNIKTDVKFNETYSEPMEIFIKIYQSVTYEIFKEDFENCDFETYLKAFTGIDIYGIDSKSKKIKILSEETA